MGKEKDHNLRNGIIAAIVSAIALPVLAWLFGWLGAAFRAVTVVIKFFLASSLMPRWLIGLLVLISLAWVYVVAKRVIRGISAAASEQSWLAYTQDVFPGFEGVIWRWGYSNRGDMILRLSAYCPQCDMLLIRRYHGAHPLGHLTTLICENCRWQLREIEGRPDDIDNRVERLIDRKLRNGEWKSVVQQPQKTQH